MRRLGARSSRLVKPVAMSALLVSLAAPAANADVGSTIISRCTHGESLSGFSQQAYHQALQELPTEVEEYSDCANLIRRAELAAAGRGGSSGSATPIPTTAAERSALARASQVGSAPLVVGNETVSPGVIHADVASALSSLPTPLLAILAFMLAFVVLLAGRAIRNRVHAHRAR
jgi:hypothetical protein